MAELGRRGGAKGGVARARSLGPARRRAIAREAARTRWSRPVLTPASRFDLGSFVAHAGSGATPAPLPRRPETWVVRAVEASRRDSALARMVPVLLWRLRQRLDGGALVRAAVRRRQVAAVGFFLELSADLGRTRAFDAALRDLRAARLSHRTAYFFAGTARRAFERAAAEAATPDAARRWGLLMNMPRESFASHFARAARL